MIEIDSSTETGLISSLANSEFQMMRFIPIVVIPQVFLCGILSLSKRWDIVGHFMPLYYFADGLLKVNLRGSSMQKMAIHIDFAGIPGVIHHYEHPTSQETGKLVK